MGSYVQRGFENSLFAGFEIGLLVIPALIFFLLRPVRPETRVIASSCLLVAAMYVTSGCLVAPQLPEWSAGGLIPRYSYYYYPAFFLSFGVLINRLLRGFSGMVVGGLVLLVFANTLGHFQPAMLLHYGSWYGVFTKG